MMLDSPIETFENLKEVKILLNTARQLQQNMQSYVNTGKIQFFESKLDQSSE